MKISRRQLLMLIKESTEDLDSVVSNAEIQKMVDFVMSGNTSSMSQAFAVAESLDIDLLSIIKERYFGDKFFDRFVFGISNSANTTSDLMLKEIRSTELGKLIPDNTEGTDIEDFEMEAVSDLTNAIDRALQDFLLKIIKFNSGA